MHTDDWALQPRQPRREEGRGGGLGGRGVRGTGTGSPRERGVGVERLGMGMGVEEGGGERIRLLHGHGHSGGGGYEVPPLMVGKQRDWRGDAPAQNGVGGDAGGGRDFSNISGVSGASTIDAPTAPDSVEKEREREREHMIMGREVHGAGGGAGMHSLPAILSDMAVPRQMLGGQEGLRERKDGGGYGGGGGGGGGTPGFRPGEGVFASGSAMGVGLGGGGRVG